MASFRGNTGLDAHSISSSLSLLPLPTETEIPRPPCGKPASFIRCCWTVRMPSRRVRKSSTTTSWRWSPSGLEVIEADQLRLAHRISQYSVFHGGSQCASIASTNSQTVDAWSQRKRRLMSQLRALADCRQAFAVLVANVLMGDRFLRR